MGLSISFDNCYLYSSSAVASKLEKKGPIGQYLDGYYNSIFAGQKTYEDAEKKMAEDAISFALQKAGMTNKDIDITLGGDLLNQIAVSSLLATSLDSSFIGVYGACSTAILSLALACLFVSSNKLTALSFTSSNYGSAERQFRYPTSYGIKKKETTTLTVSGAGAAIVSNKKTKIKIIRATFGKSFDSKTSNVSDMGSIMALAAYNSIIDHLKNNNQKIEDYDLILTGDLSEVGSKVLKDMLEVEGYKTSVIQDAGNLVYQKKSKQKFAGGSGCACLAISAYTYVVQSMVKGNLRHVLLVGTGALHSKVSTLQGKSIPVIAHCIEWIKETKK